MARFSIAYLLSFLFFLNITPAQAATYLYDDTVTFAWQSSTPTNVAWDGTCTNYPIDDDKQLVNIGFSFNFAGTNYTQVRIIGNGALHFGADQGFHTDYTNEALPVTGVGAGPCSASPADRVITGYWGDLNPAQGGSVTYETMGSAPNRLFVATWNNIPQYFDTGNYTFQTILYETSNEIILQYGPGNANGTNATIGVEVSDSDFTQYSYNTDSVTNGDAILFFQAPPPPTLDLRLDECVWSGTTIDVLDSSGNNLHGSAVGSLSPLDITGENGGMCMAANLTGSPHVEVSDNDLLDISDHLTIMAWVKPNALPASGLKTILSKDENYEFHIDTGGHIYWWWNDSSGTAHTLSSTTALAAGTWYHIAIRFQSGTATIFINGQPDSSASTYPATLLTNSDPLQIGADQGFAGREFEGYIDEILLFSSALSDGQLDYIYTNQSNDLNHDGSARTCSTCASNLAYYQLDESFWGVVTDSSGNNNHGAIIGTVTPVTIAPAIAGSPGTCGYAEINMNTNVNIYDAIDTGVDVNNDIGDAGTISFWYKSNERWNGNNGDRQLFDASRGNKYFFLVLLNNSRLRFGLEDTNDTNFTLDTGNNNFAAGAWVHIAVTWDLDSDQMRIFLNGSQAASRNINSNGSLGDLDSLYMGDNRSTYLASGSSRNSANGAIDEVRLYNSAQDQAAIQADMNATHPCGAVVDHYSISHSGMGVTCEAEPVTITGHDSAHNTLTPLSTISISTTPTADGWSLQSGTPANFSDLGSGQASYTFATGESSVTLWLTMTTASIVDIDIIDDTGNTEASGTALAGDDPPLDFRDTGFRFYADGVANSIGTQIAGKESNIAPDSQLLTLRAVQTNTDTMACEARLTGPQTIDMAFECITPTTCQTNNGVQISGIAIADNPLGGVASYIPVTLDFGATGTAAFTLNYADVGQISLHAEKDIAALAPDPPITLTGSSNPFTVRPFALLVTATGNPGTVDANGAIFTKAGADFSATVTAVAWQAVDDLDNNGMADGHDDGDPTTHADLSDNTVTPNFGREASPEAVTLTALLDQPVGGHDPGLAGATQLTAFANGAATTLVRYDEVGIIELAAAVDDGDYLAIGPAATAAITGKSGYVGRFPPHNFLVTISPAPPLFTDACVAGNYSYLGETFPFATPPTITITAVSGAPTPTITQNYDCGGFWKFTTPLDLAYSYTDSSGHGLALTPAAGTVNPLMADTTDCTGFVQLTLLDTLSYARPATTSPLAPFAASVDLTVNQDQFRDSDLVCFDTGGGCQGFSQTAITGTTLRHGLVQVFNSFGPETMDITNSPFAAQYYDGTSWVTNSEDDCSTALLFCSTPVADRVPPLSIQPDPLSGGQGTLTVTTAGISGETVDVCLTAPAWLSETDCTAPGPTCGTFTFGIYRGNDRIINWREVIQ